MSEIKLARLPKGWVRTISKDTATNLSLTRINKDGSIDYITPRPTGQ